MKRRFAALGSAVCYVLLFLAAQFVTTFASALLFGVIAGVRIVVGGTEGIPVSGDVTADLVSCVTITSAAVVYGTMLLIFALRDRPFGQETGFHMFPAEDIPAPFLFGYGGSALCALLMSFLLALLPQSDELLSEYNGTVTELFGGNAVLSFLSVVIAAPLAEELIFRGLVYTRLRRAFPAVISALITGILFGLVHGNLIQGVYAFVFGVLLCIVFEKYRSLWASVLFHIGFNLCGFAESYLFEDDLFFFAVCTAVAVVGFTLFLCHRTEVDGGTWAQTVGTSRGGEPKPPHSRDGRGSFFSVNEVTIK